MGVYSSSCMALVVWPYIHLLHPSQCRDGARRFSPTTLLATVFFGANDLRIYCFQCRPTPGSAVPLSARRIIGVPRTRHDQSVDPSMSRPSVLKGYRISKYYTDQKSRQYRSDIHVETALTIRIESISQDSLHINKILISKDHRYRKTYQGQKKTNLMYRASGALRTHHRKSDSCDYCPYLRGRTAPLALSLAPAEELKKK